MTGLKAQQTLLVVATAMKKLYKAGARSSVTLAAQNADRRAAVSEIELALSTPSRRSDFSEADGQRIKLTGVPASDANAVNNPERSITGSPRPRAAAAAAGS